MSTRNIQHYDVIIAVASGGPDAVRRHQAERDELSLRLLCVTGRMASFDWTADQTGAYLLELGAAVAGETAAMTSGDPGLRLELASAQTGGLRCGIRWYSAG